MAACAGLVDGRSRQTSGSASAAGSDGSTWRRNRLAALPPFRQTRRSRGCARRKPAKSLGTALRMSASGCLRARTLAARPTRPRRPASSAPAARHSPAPDRSPGSRPRSARRRCADARSSGLAQRDGAGHGAQHQHPGLRRRHRGEALQDRRVRRRRPVRAWRAAWLAGRPAAGALSVFSCRKDSAPFADVDCRTAQARCAMPARDRPMDGTVLASGGTTAMAGPPLSSYS